ncbi:zinc-ribbon domain-containing protein [Candidatus Bathyarchaeota archaeon]|nr:MAG: zinc-ribbon domain-containing protein [Candidatus Bathyarchaeota archaeon]
MYDTETFELQGFCENCKTQNPDHAVYCKNCGTKLGS